MVKSLWMGGEEEVTVRVFMFAISPASHRTQRGHGHCRMLLQGTGAKTPSGAAPTGAQIPSGAVRGLKLNLERNRGQDSAGPGDSPHTPPKQGEHLFKDEVLVIGAVIGASWDVPGDPYKGLRGAGGLLQPMTWRGGEGVVWLLDGGIGASWGEMQGSSRACTLTCRGEVGFWPGKGLEAVVSGWGEGLNLPAQPWPHQLCFPGPRDPLPDG